MPTGPFSKAGIPDEAQGPWRWTAPSNKGMKLTSPELTGGSQLIPVFAGHPCYGLDDGRSTANERRLRAQPGVTSPGRCCSTDALPTEASPRTLATEERRRSGYGNGLRKSATNNGHGIAEGRDGGCSTALLERMATPDGDASEQGDEADEAKRIEASQLIPSVGPTFP